ncbi:proline dehydrogenase family protein [Rubrobacter marinus]|uniref:proline dehydrogenase family protein n=1 Tax=Rubrobacter marinus TaxID=2653852 RepID=UPI001D181D11|nr:proline dehydrogenase family protein [Rubrobacter marinus]
MDRVIANSVPAIPRPVVRRISRRYMAGEDLEEAIGTVRDLNKQGCVATLDVLGESTKDRADAAGKLEQYKRVIDAVVENDLASGVSVKLTGLGLDLDEGLCRSNLEEVIVYAGERGRFVRVDMEDSSYTARTIRIVLDMHERHGNTGAVVQAYLRRSLGDVRLLAEAGVSVRLCKGIYVEPREVAYKGFDTVRQNFVLLLEELMKAGCYVGVATHDEYLVWHALRVSHELGIPKGGYEFQMLLGVDEQLRRILVEGGQKVRVYVPFGKDWYEYSTRRLKENPKIARYVAQDVVGGALGLIKRR